MQHVCDQVVSELPMRWHYWCHHKPLLLYIGRVKLAESFPPWNNAVACMIVGKYLVKYKHVFHLLIWHIKKLENCTCTECCFK